MDESGRGADAMRSHTDLSGMGMWKRGEKLKGILAWI